MEQNSEMVWRLLNEIREAAPVIQCITNIVTANDCANLLLAAGASPIMSHYTPVAAEVAQGADALVCNFGAIEHFEAMQRSGGQARRKGHPIVFDPVGVSGSPYVLRKCGELAREISPVCIRGNRSEIRAILDGASTAVGVDASPEENTEKSMEELIPRMEAYAAEHGTILIASGADDIITDGRETWLCGNGEPIMARITGSGCMSSALLGAFFSVEKSVQSAAACCAMMGICGEIGAARAKQLGGGTMTFRDAMIDAAYLLKEEDTRLVRLTKRKARIR